MNHELLAILDYMEQDRGVSKDQLIDAVEKALLTASRKSIHPASDLEVKIDRTTGDIRAWANLEVVEANPNNDQILLSAARVRYPEVQPGETVKWEVTPKDFGRIAAQTAKQAILQQIRKAEKAIVKDEFEDKVGQIVNGVVRRYDAGSIIVDLQKAEGILSPRDKVPTEQYMPGDRINAVLLKVDINVAGPSLILSRTSPLFIRRLLEREVSEIHDGVVEIVAIARDPGVRTKIAVRSGDPRIDPVGACVGMRGMRVKNITNELGGERVDVINYSDNIMEYAANALHPAKAEKIEVDRNAKVVTFYVSPENSRLAFGKKAQNVKLAQKLLGWKIDIKAVEEAPEEEKTESFDEKKAHITEHLSGLLGISLEDAAVLVNNGFLTIDGLKAVQVSDLEAIEGLSPETVSVIVDKIAKQNSAEASQED